MLILIAGEVAGGRHYRRCDRNWRLGRCDLVGQSASNDGREKVHRVRRFRLEARVGSLFLGAFLP